MRHSTLEWGAPSLAAPTVAHRAHMKHVRGPAPLVRTSRTRRTRCTQRTHSYALVRTRAHWPAPNAY